MADLFFDRDDLLAAVLVALALERGVELVLSHNNLARLRAIGAPHAAASGLAEYAVMVVVHVLFLVAPAIEVNLRGMRLPGAVAGLAVGILVFAQALRWWTIHTLGPRWNARAVVAPSLGAVHGGPYRFLRHPNYLAVNLEFAALPFVGGSLWSGALIFFANAVLLWRRRRQEEDLLAGIPGWREGFAR